MGQSWVQQIWEKKLTLDHHVLTSLLVILESPTDLVSQTVTLMAECLEALAPRNPLCQLSLGTEDHKKTFGRKGSLTTT